MTNPFIRDDVKAFLAAVAASGRPSVDQLDPPSARAGFKAMRGFSDLDIGELAVKRELRVAGAVGEIDARLFDPRQERGPGPVVLFFHGGGFVIGDIDTHEALCAEMARELDLPVVSVDYRLAPEAPFPAAPEDCIAAARWIAANGASFGREATGLIVSGDSAGGNLAVVTAMALRDAPAAVPVVAQALLYPIVERVRPEGSARDFAEGFLLTKDAMLWFDAQYRAKDDDFRAHPLSVDQAGMPATLVMTAGLDPMRDQGRRYVAACAEAGIEAHYLEAVGNIHGFACIRRAIPSSQGDVARFLAHLKLMVSA